MSLKNGPKHSYSVRFTGSNLRTSQNIVFDDVTRKIDNIANKPARTRRNLATVLSRRVADLTLLNDPTPRVPQHSIPPSQLLICEAVTILP